MPETRLVFLQLTEEAASANQPLAGVSRAQKHTRFASNLDYKPGHFYVSQCFIPLKKNDYYLLLKEGLN